MNRLSEASYPWGREQFTYDQADNRIQRVHTACQMDKTACPDALDMQGITKDMDAYGDQYASQKGVTYTDRYFYDERNRLVRAVLNEYNAFGNRVECEEQVENRFGFAGELYNPVSALIYLRARFYNPVIGRFLQEDNVYEDGLNLYVYCRNNPVRYVDPSGHGIESLADKDDSGKEDHSGDIEALKEIVDEINVKGGAKPDEAAILKEWADTWKDFLDPNNWKEGVNNALFNPDMEIIVNLDGVDNPMLAVQRAASNIGGATDWELLQIKSSPDAWDRITWYKNGEIVKNPFE